MRLPLETVDPRPVRARRDWCGGCGRASACSGRCWPGAAGPSCRCPAAATSATGPVDLHLKGLAALGADLRLEHGYVVATARRLTGADIDLSGPNGPTVTGTANVLSAAVLARGDDDHPRRGHRAGDRRSGQFSDRPGRTDRRAGNAHDPHRGRGSTRRRDAPAHPRPHRGGHAVDGRGDYRRLGHGRGRRAGASERGVGEASRGGRRDRRGRRPRVDRRRRPGSAPSTLSPSPIRAFPPTSRPNGRR